MTVENVSFPSSSPPTLFQAARERDAFPVEGRGRLFWPDAEASERRRPAVVLLPGLGGMAESREPRYGAFLARHGYVALACDTFAERGAGEASLLRRALTISETMMAADAFAALRHLAADPRIDPDRIAVVGFSYGGLAAILCAYRQVADTLAGPGGPRFCAHASYYGCAVARLADPTTTGAPVAILVGDRDRNVELDHVQAIADDLRRGGSPVELQIYPGVCHQWDGPHEGIERVRPSPRRLRLTVGPDGRARDARTGIVVQGAWTRAAAIVANADPRGYDMLRDEALIARTDDRLLALLARGGGRPAQAPAGAAQPKRPGAAPRGGRSRSPRP